MAPETHTLKDRLAPLMRWESGLAVALVAVAIFGNSVSSQFFSSYNIFTLCTNIGDLALLALPMTLIIITGEIDLSVASVLAVSAETLGALWTHHWPMALIFVVCLAIGALAGLINGVLITRVGLPSLAVTIGTLTLYRGLANVILGASTVSNFPSPFNTLGVNGFLGISWLSWSVAIFLVFAVITGDRAAHDSVWTVAVRDRAQPGSRLPRRASASSARSFCCSCSRAWWPLPSACSTPSSCPQPARTSASGSSFRSSRSCCSAASRSSAARARSSGSLWRRSCTRACAVHCC